MASSVVGAIVTVRRISCSIQKDVQAVQSAIICLESSLIDFLAVTYLDTIKQDTMQLGPWCREVINKKDVH